MPTATYVPLTYGKGKETLHLMLAAQDTPTVEDDKMQAEIEINMLGGPLHFSSNGSGTPLEKRPAPFRRNLAACASDPFPQGVLLLIIKRSDPPGLREWIRDFTQTVLFPRKLLQKTPKIIPATRFQFFNFKKKVT